MVAAGDSLAMVHGELQGVIPDHLLSPPEYQTLYLGFMAKLVFTFLVDRV